MNLNNECCCFSVLHNITQSFNANVKLCIQTRWKSDIQIAICVSVDAGLYFSFLTAVDWQLVSLNLREGVHAFPRGPFFGLFVARNVGWREKKASYGMKVLFPLLLMASGVSARSHSASPHLLRTKRGLMGVHTTELHSKGIGQGDSSLLPAACLFTKNRLHFLLLCLIYYFCLLLFPSQTERHETAENLKWCKTADYLSDIFTLQKNCDLNNSLMTQQLELSGAIKIFSPPHVSCTASFPKADL